MPSMPDTDAFLQTWLKQNEDGMTWKEEGLNGTTCPQCQTRMQFNRLRDDISDTDAFLIDTEMQFQTGMHFQ